MWFVYYVKSSFEIYLIVKNLLDTLVRHPVHLTLYFTFKPVIFIKSIIETKLLIFIKIKLLIMVFLFYFNNFKIVLFINKCVRKNIFYEILDKYFVKRYLKIC